MFRNHRRTLAWAASLVLLPALGACGDDPTGPRDPEDVEFAASLGIDLDQMTRLESGVYIQTVQDGTGLPVTTGDVSVDYKLWLPDGTLVDESPLNQPLSFTFGEGRVIPGFEAGVSGMRVGEIRKIVVPSDQGYGTNPPRNSGIPSNSVLVFQVEMVSGGTPD